MPATQEDPKLALEEFYPLTPTQQGMLLHSISAPHAGVYVQQLVCELHEELNVAHFRSAWQRVVDRHSVLRTQFNLEDAREPRQEVLERILVPLEEEDWREAGSQDAKQRLEVYLREDRRRGFAIERAPLWRMNLLRLAENEYRLVWTSHHALLDGRSRRLVLQEVFALYEAFCGDRDLPVGQPPPFGDHVRWLAAQDCGAAEGYWKKLLAGFPVATPLPMASSCGVDIDEEDCHRTLELWLTEELTLALENLAQTCQVTFNTVLQGAWALLLSFYSGTEDVVFGATRACRRSSVPDADSVVGLLINTLPVRTRVKASVPLLSWLKELRSQWIALRAHEHSSLAQVQGWSDVPTGNPLFKSIVVFENSRLEATLEKQGTARAGRQFYLRGITNYPLVLSGFFGPRVLIELTYDRRRIEDDTIARMRQHLRILLEGIAADPRRTLGELPILSPLERRQLAVEWNNTAAPLPQQDCIPRLFEAQVERTPQATALIFGGNHLTYDELNVRANRIAHCLRRLGVGPETPVAICLERSPELVIGLLGILKAGGAYVPLDPAYPKERLLFILRDTRATVLLTQQTLHLSLPEHAAQVIYLDADAAAIDSHDDVNPSCLVTSENLAYIMYTSGSTGTPKGVAVPHRGVVRLLFGVDYARLDADRSILQMAPATFDASTFEIWGALLHGGRCVLFPGRVPDLEMLGQLLREHQVDTLWLTAALFNAVIDDSPEVLTGVRQLLIGGEALSVAHVRRALARLPATTLINGYGPTEATTFTCCYRIPSEIPKGARSIPIGKPIGNTSVYLLDACGRLVPIGVPGEIHVGGPGVARGYWNQPELTADRFIPDRFGTEPGARLYRTGDIARYLPDGNIEFLGRLDGQVKIRGFRIEPGEVESALRRHPALREVIVVPQDEPGGAGRRLVAYVVLRGETPPAVSELRDFLAEILPEHMVPSVFLVLDELPLSSNGKVDRQRLPSPNTVRIDGERLVAPPRTPAEEKLVVIFAELLGHDRVGIHDDFFELGGHSLLAIQAVSRARQALGVELPLTSLFETATAAGLAETAMKRIKPSNTEQSWPPISVPRGRAFPLLSSQLSFWGDWRDHPGNPSTNVSRAYRLQGPLNARALEEALHALLERHEALRSTFAEVDGAPAQFVGEAECLQLRLVDLSRLSEPNRLAAAQDHFDEESRYRFDLAKDRMLRSLLLRLDDEDHVLVLIVHHIVMDGWSLGIFNRDLSELYEAFSTGRLVRLPDLPFQPADFACWERRHFQGEIAQRHMAYWKKHLERAPATPPLPGDGPETEPGDFRSLRHSILIEGNLADSLRRLAREERCTLAMALLAALNVLIHESIGQDDILVGYTMAARTRPEVEGLIGGFRKMMSLRTDLTGKPTFRELLGRVRDVATGAYLHLDVSQEIVFPEWGWGHQHFVAKAPVVLNFVERLGQNPTLRGLSLSSIQLPHDHAMSFGVMVFDFIEQERDILVRLRSRYGMYSRSKALGYLESFHALLRRLVAAPNQRFSGATRPPHS